MILAFYLGVGFALTIFLLRVPVARDEVNAPAVGATLVMIAAWVMGTRVAFSMPIDLRANWIFRVLPVRSGTECVAGRRRALLLLAVMPVCTGTAAMLFAMWPWRAAAAYIAILVLTGFTLAEMALYGALKIPFTCSYLPGKSNVHLTFWFCLGILIQILGRAAVLATRAVKNPRTYMAVVCSLIVAAAIARRRNSAADEALQFEAEDPGAVQVLGLSR
jgi:hypothetical protein